MERVQFFLNKKALPLGTWDESGIGSGVSLKIATFVVL
ncbi:hypothetical protein B4153_3287 [Bacillus cereus]|nr:hypothetical protein bcere0013_29830 [Bacillus cereus BDRD-ST26]KLA07286.1 hypothetical protein B4153_3287 [Bacillus cereus]